MFVYSSKKNTLPSNIEIKKVSVKNSAEILKLQLLAKNVMPEYFEGLIENFNNGIYEDVLIAYDKTTNKVVGGCLFADLCKFETPVDGKLSNSQTNKNLFLDFVFVDPNYTHQKIGSNLIDSVYDYAIQKQYKFIQLMCPLQNSLNENIYDKNGFYKTTILGEGENRFVEFRAPVKPEIRKFGNLVYAIYLDARANDCENYGEFKNDVLDGYVPKIISDFSQIDNEELKEILTSGKFQKLNPLLSSLITEQVDIFDSVDQLSKILKIRSVEKTPYLRKPANYFKKPSINYYRDNIDYKNAHDVLNIANYVKHKIISDDLITMCGGK